MILIHENDELKDEVGRKEGIPTPESKFLKMKPGRYNFSPI